MNGLGFDKGHVLVQIFFRTEIRQTDTSVGQGQLIFCLCFAGGQSQKKKRASKRGKKIRKNLTIII